VGFGFGVLPCRLNDVMWRIWMHHDSIILEMISSHRKSCFELISTVKGNMVSNW
jgi:hypothetical protein